MWHVRSRASCPNARFALPDLEDDVSSDLIVVKREKVVLPLPPNKPLIDLTMKTLISYKRKTLEVTDLNLENLGAKGCL